MRTLTTAFMIFILSTSALAWDLNLVDSRPLADTPVHINVISTSSGDLYAYLLTDQSPYQVIVQPIDGDPRAVSVGQRPQHSVGQLDEDGSLRIFTGAGWGGGSDFVIRIDLLPDSSTVQFVKLYSPDWSTGGAPWDIHRYRVHLEDRHHPDSIMVVLETDTEEKVWDATISFEENRRGISYVLDADLNPLFRWSARTMQFINLDSSGSASFAYASAYWQYRSDDWGTYSSGYGSEGIARLDSTVVENHSYSGRHNGLVVTGDISVNYSGDEIVFNSPTEGIIEANPTEWNLSAYYLDNDTVKQAWYVPSHEFADLFYYQSRNLVVGLTRAHQVHVFDAATGTLLETIPVNPDIIFYNFHETAAPSGRLLIVGREANELQLYELAEFTDIEDVESDLILPDELRISAAWPNPFNAEVTIMLDLPSRRHTIVDIVNLLGQTVATISDGELSAGQHQLRWDGYTEDGTPAASGIYFARARDDTSVATVKIQLLK